MGELYLGNHWSDLSKNWNMIILSPNFNKIGDGEVKFFLSFLCDLTWNDPSVKNTLVGWSILDMHQTLLVAKYLVVEL